ncbi:hypothetical protein C7459_117112 [Tumebacillus permanentifrigoris]|uniref:Uncharacterized protein n=1 Tax=Tumebacillus permanentifrigoris TaxID=378543 RepID=A0A316D4W4_9BACL|nr:hypothetical protein C7459_117112 [Tumebacillus permanentifrigoris]
MENDQFVVDCGGEWILKFEPKPNDYRVVPEILHAVMAQFDRGIYVVRPNTKHVKRVTNYVYTSFGIEYTILRERR